MKLLITGATSMIGLALTRSLLAQGHSVTAVIRRESPALRELVPSGRLSVLLCEMCDYARLTDASCGADAAIFLAWNGTRGEARMDAALQQANCVNTLRGVRAALASGCRKIVLAGSQAEYGPHTEQITEGTVCRPNTEYGKAKLALYEQASAWCAQMGALCVEPRFFSLYGPEDYAGTMVMSMLRHMRRGEPCPLTEGIQMWDFLYIRDAIEALSALCTMACPGGVYNFGSGEARTLRAYVEEMAAVSQTRSALQFGAVPYPATGMVSLWPDVSRLKNTLGWQPCTSFAAGIGEILSSMQKEEPVS